MSRCACPLYPYLYLYCTFSCFLCRVGRVCRIGVFVEFGVFGVFGVSGERIGFGPDPDVSSLPSAPLAGGTSVICQWAAGASSLLSFLLFSSDRASCPLPLPLCVSRLVPCFSPLPPCVSYCASRAVPLAPRASCRPAPRASCRPARSSTWPAVWEVGANWPNGGRSRVSLPSHSSLLVARFSVARARVVP